MSESSPYTSDPQYIHGEAFMLMLYECKECPEREILWNSRDGVTPFGIGCRQCGGLLQHVAWKSDLRAPDYKPQPGQRFFRDGTPDEAESIMRERIDRMKGTAYEVTDENYRKELLAAARSGDGEFRKGWPTIDTTMEVNQ